MALRYDETEQEILLGLAYDSIEATVNKRRLPRFDPAIIPAHLLEQRSSFVTLSHGDRLRGCIGSLEPKLPLAQDIILRASSAAKDDPRFPPLQRHELSGLTIEISVLSLPEPLHLEKRADLPAVLHPGVDGVTLTYGRSRATFLPQVWERVPDPVLFLELLCRKAGLSQQAWHELPLQFSTYKVVSFERIYTDEDTNHRSAA